MSDSKGHNPADTGEQDERRITGKAASELARQQEKDDVGWLMTHREGRRIVWRVLARAGIYRIAYHQNDRDEAFQLGQQALGFEAFAEINTVCPNLYIKMLQENISAG